MTVYKGRGAYIEAPPQILLQGKWLERAGFNARIKLQWTASRNGLSSQRMSQKQILERDNRQILIFYERLL